MKDSVTDTLIADLMQDGEECVVVRGGEGGVGNAMFGSEVHRRPRECTPGEDGEKRMLDVEMKTIADLGLVRSVVYMYAHTGTQMHTCGDDAFPFIVG